MEQIQQNPVQMSWIQKMDIMIKEIKEEKRAMPSSGKLNEEGTATK